MGGGYEAEQTTSPRAGPAWVPNPSRDHPGEGIASRLPFWKLGSDRSPAVHYLKCEGTYVSPVWAHSTLSAHDLDQVVPLSFLVIQYRDTQNYHATIMEKSLSKFLCHFFIIIINTGFHCVALAVQELCRPGWPRTRDPPVSASRVVGLKAYTTTTPRIE